MVSRKDVLLRRTNIKKNTTAPLNACRNIKFLMWSLLMKRRLFTISDVKVRQVQAEIVETTFVVSLFSDIQKETTLFLVVLRKTDQERSSFSFGSEK